MLTKSISLSEKEQNFIEYISHELVERQIGIFGIFFLESFLPFSFFASQFLILLEPLVNIIYPLKSYKTLISIVSDRNKYEYLIDTIERELERKGNKKNGK